MSKYYMIADIHGMCGGVFSALRKLDETIAGADGKTVFVLHELVHNTTVTAEYEARNVCFTDDINAIPSGAIAVIGAHGVDMQTEALLRSRAATVVDATCPLVKKLHDIAASLEDDRELVIFGRSGHPEVTGVAGNSRAGKTFIVASDSDIAALPELKRPYFISQTTVDAARSDTALNLLKERFPQLEYSAGVCDASFKRQNAVIALAKRCPVVIVAGSAHSSNACRLQEIAAEHGAKSFRVDSHEEIPGEILEKAPLIGITSGASTPTRAVDAIIRCLTEHGFVPAQD